MSDYDYPKPLSTSQAMEDYDYPRGSGYNGERYLSAVPSQLKRASDSSGDGRPFSQSSGSVYSADTSSGSLDLSLTGSRELHHGYDVPKRAILQGSSPQVHQSEVNLDEELRKIDGIVEGVTQQRIRGTQSVSSSNRVTLDGFEISGLGKHLTAGGESKRSSSSNQESLSSRSGSNDTLGVWDDVSFEDSDEFDSGVGEGGVSGGRGGGEGEVEKEKGGGEMLDSWIKELESGMQGMSEVAGIGGEIQNVAVVSVGSEGGREGGRKGAGYNVYVHYVHVLQCCVCACVRVHSSSIFFPTPVTRSPDTHYTATIPCKETTTTPSTPTLTHHP